MNKEEKKEKLNQLFNILNELLEANVIRFNEWGHMTQIYEIITARFIEESKNE